MTRRGYVGPILDLEKNTTQPIAGLRSMFQVVCTMPTYYAYHAISA